MTTYQLRKQAVEMEVPYHEAAFCRFRFTREQMFIESAAMDQIDSVNFDNEQGIKNYIIFTDSLDRFIDLAKESRALFLSVTRKESTDRITDEQIEQARAYPIDKLIEFTRGKLLHHVTMTTPLHSVMTASAIGQPALCVTSHSIPLTTSS